jgi:hypothetical protein
VASPGSGLRQGVIGRERHFVRVTAAYTMTGPRGGE